MSGDLFSIKDGQKVDAELWAELLGEDKADDYAVDLATEAVPEDEPEADPSPDIDEILDEVLKSLAADASAVNLPDISDVSFPSMIGAIPSKPPVKKRKPFKYKGVQLSRKPMKFEVQVVSLTEIPPRLDLATKTLVEADTDEQLMETLTDVANYGAHEVLRELVRQGATDRLLSAELPRLSARSIWLTLTSDRALELSSAREQIRHKLSQRNLSGARLTEWTEDLLSRRLPAMTKRYAARAVNDAFSFGRTVAIDSFRRRRDFDLKAYRDENGKFISVLDAVSGGDILVDAVVQTAIMDTWTCDECSVVDGEVMDFGDARQLELHPPYVKCLGGDRCRCIQIAILDNGDEVNVDEIEEDTF